MSVGSMDAGAAPAAGGAVPRFGAVQRLTGAFSSPVRVFEDIARKPTVVVVLLALISVALISQAVVIPKLDVETGLREQFAKSGMPEEQLERALGMASTFKWIGLAAVPIAFPLTFAMIAGLYFLALKLVGSAKPDFVVLLSALAHAAFPPTVVRGALTVVVVLSRHRIDPFEAGHLVRSNVGAFLPEGTSPALVALGDRIDVFGLWEVALVTLALATVGRVSTARAAAIAVVFWLVTTLFLVGAGALQGLAGG